MKKRRHRKGLYPQKGQKRAAKLRRRAHRFDKQARFWLKVAHADAQKQRARAGGVGLVAGVAKVGTVLSAAVAKLAGR